MLSNHSTLFMVMCDAMWLKAILSQTVWCYIVLCDVVCHKCDVKLNCMLRDHNETTWKDMTPIDNKSWFVTLSGVTSCNVMWHNMSLCNDP